MRFTGLALTLTAALALTPAASAQIITQWNFNSIVGDGTVSTGVTTPSTGSGTLALQGGTTSTFATGSPSDPNTTDNSGLNTATYPAQGTNSGSAGVRYNASTVGSTGQIGISLDFRQSGTAARNWQLQASSDGTTFANVNGGMASIVGPIPAPNTQTSFTNTGLYTNDATAAGQTFVQGISYLFAAGSAFENNSLFAFRWVSVFDPATGGTAYSPASSTSTYGTSGSARFDLVTVTNVVPEPGSLALCGMAVAGVAGRVLRRK